MELGLVPDPPAAWSGADAVERQTECEPEVRLRERGGDRDEGPNDDDDAGPLDPQGSVDVGAQLGEVCPGGEFGACVLLDADDCAGLLLIEAGVAELVRGGEGVEGGSGDVEPPVPGPDPTPAPGLRVRGPWRGTPSPNFFARARAAVRFQGVLGHDRGRSDEARALRRRSHARHRSGLTRRRGQLGRGSSRRHRPSRLPEPVNMPHRKPRHDMVFADRFGR